jgi:hypothetical protein
MPQMGTTGSWWLSLLACVVLLATPPPAVAAGAAYLLRPDRVWNGVEDASHAGWAVLVRDGVIVAAGPEHGIDAGDAQVVDLPGSTLVPGLVDLHSHLFLHPYNEASWNDQVLKEPEAYRTIEAARHARDTLLAGFTTLRDLGTEGAGYADVSVQRAIDEGMIPGPRLFVATRAIVATDSYGPGPRGFRPDIDLPGGAQEASGADAVIAAVREQAGTAPTGSRCMRTTASAPTAVRNRRSRPPNSRRWSKRRTCRAGRSPRTAPPMPACAWRSTPGWTASNTATAAARRRSDECANAASPTCRP